MFVKGWMCFFSPLYTYRYSHNFRGLNFGFQLLRHKTNPYPKMEPHPNLEMWNFGILKLVDIPSVPYF